jgi:hypothetical protein
MNLREIDQVRRTVARGYGAEQRASYYHYLGKDAFPEWYLKEIHRLSAKYRPIRYLPLDVPKFEIDKKEFLDWWDEESIDIVRTSPDSAEPWTKEAHPLGKASNWHRPQFKGVDIYFDDPPNFERDRGIAWTNELKPHPLFDRIIEQIRDTMPFYHIRSIYLWESLRPVAPHRDACYFWDLPLMFRIMLNDENDPVKEPTLYVADVDHSDAHYIKLPEDTNTFVWSNGSQLHGSDFHGKRKQLICINHTIDISKYEELLDRSIEKYRDQLNYKLEM